jgi:hypothetical protein
VQSRDWRQGVGILLSIIAALLLGQNSAAQEGVDQEIVRLEANARIDCGQVTAPIGRILLIRKGKDTCAVRFTEFHRDHDAKKPTVFNSGDETFGAEYDWYCQEDGSHDLTKPNVKSGHRSLVRKPLIGFFRLAFQTGETFIKCGPFKLWWWYPSFVSFYGGPEQGDYGVEITPTRRKDIKGVNTLETRLKWYRYDERRKAIYVPLDEL